MLQHHKETKEEAQLQRYLDDLEKPVTTLGEAERQEWRAEAEAHLCSMIAAYEELGMSHEEAVQTALARFGKPTPLGFRMRLAELRRAAKQNPENRVTNFVVSCGARFVLPALASFLLFVLLYTYTDSPSAHFLARNITRGMLLLGPFLCGWQLGGRLPWLQNEIRRVREVHGERGITRLRMGLFGAAVATTFELSLFWSMLRRLSDSADPHLLATDFLPALVWLPITLGVAYYRAIRQRTLSEAGE
jgi:hypothetical protein